MTAFNTASVKLMNRPPYPKIDFATVPIGPAPTPLSPHALGYTCLSHLTFATPVAYMKELMLQTIIPTLDLYYEKISLQNHNRDEVWNHLQLDVIGEDFFALQKQCVIGVGSKVRVASGNKVPVGIVGIVRWIGPNKPFPGATKPVTGMRVGILAENQKNLIFVDQKHVEKLWT